MTVLNLIAFPAFLLENTHLISLRMAEHFSFHSHPFERGGSDLNVSVILGKEHVIKGDLIAFLGIDLVNDDPLVLLYLILMASYIYDRVHGSIY